MSSIPVPDHIATLRPYIPGKPIDEVRRERGLSGEILKLASNENPYGPSPRAIAAARQAVDDVNLYPDGGAFYLKRRIAEYLGDWVTPKNIAVGNGSNESIEHLIRVFCTQQDSVVVSQYGFIMYSVCLAAHGVPKIEVPARDATHDLVAMADAVVDNTRLMFIANPNNPTGTHNQKDELVACLERLNERGMNPLVAVDEAYIDYVDDPDYPNSLELHGLYENLVTMRTFSKSYGLAGFRVGYLIARPEVIGCIERLRAPFNVGVVSQAAATAALDDNDYLATTTAAARRDRVELRNALLDMGLEVLPTQTNFVLVNFPHDATTIFDKMLDRGVIVRPLPVYGHAGWVRISCGKPAQNQRLVDTVKDVLDALGTP